MRILSVDDRLENDVQRAVTAFYRTFNIQIARFSERRTGRTRITPGWPDLALGCERKRAFWVHETKRVRGGIQSSEQSDMQRWLEACGVPYLIGGVQEAHDHLVKIGVLEP
jgi:hypothetical protein